MIAPRSRCCGLAGPATGRIHRSSAAAIPPPVAPYRATMAVDERARHELYEQAEAAMGRGSADTLMSLLPPVGWADVATKHDLAELETRLDGRIDALGDRVLGAMRQELNGMVLKMFALVVALVAALVVPLVTLT